MIKLLAILMLLSGSVPVSLLEELAIKSRTLAPIVEMADLYFSAGILDYLPLRIPVVGGRYLLPMGIVKILLLERGDFMPALTMPVNWLLRFMLQLLVLSVLSGTAAGMENV